MPTGRNISIMHAEQRAKAVSRHNKTSMLHTYP